ncbi:amino acid ABC transporter permease [Jiella sp. MQZ9-1]|uniref:Amino acid ABC transporter permease n=1 Tax=Jiella flava TaxID=2816857 RepID=A0A939JW07_9HYPH|nr:amino acid ABC transporter permease [Jiella flava]MBO0662542.1 amino acid ABC transporter permease [Jiella flava]MCD2472913.1 amino acid ABC transporter permease [Jiella flava]
MMAGLAIVWSQRDLVLSGFYNTVLLTLACLAISLPLGVLGAVFLLEAPNRLRRICAAFVDLLRCVPFLLLAYVVYYGLPELGLRFEAWGAGLITLVIYNTAYLIEIFRSAGMVLPREELEAARAFGLTTPLIYRRIVLPQIALSAAPVVGNQVIVMIKDSALLMIITVQELTFAANFLSTNYFTPFAPFAVAMLLYWSLCLIVELVVGRLIRLRRSRHG